MNSGMEWTRKKEELKNAYEAIWVFCVYMRVIILFGNLNIRNIANEKDLLSKQDFEGMSFRFIIAYT